jgi:hypothetical protein
MNKDNELLLNQVEATVNGLITKRKLRWLSDTLEFKEGLLIGLELAGIYGKQFSEIYKAEGTNILRDDSTDSVMREDDTPSPTPDPTPTPSED